MLLLYLSKRGTMALAQLGAMLIVVTRKQEDLQFLKYKPKEKDLELRKYLKRLLVISQDQGYWSLIKSVDCLPKFGDWTWLV